MEGWVRYVNALNAAEEQLDAAIAAKDLKKQIQLQSAINFNGGGHLNVRPPLSALTVWADGWVVGWHSTRCSGRA